MPAYPVVPHFPLTRGLAFQTRVVQYQNTTEQRWPLVAGSESWRLTHSGISLADRNLILGVFESVTGDRDETVDITLGSDTYTGYHFDAARLEFTERSQGRWDGSVPLRKTARTPDAQALPADFPVLSTGNRVQLPYTHGRAFENVSVATEGGRYAYARRSASMRTWSAGGASLSNADALAIWNMFSRARGRWAAFGFTDPDSGVRYASCRFAADTLEWRLVGPDENAIEVQIVEIP